MLESTLLFVSLLAGYFFCKIQVSVKNLRIINICLEIIVVSIIILTGYNFSIFTHANAIILEVTELALVYSAALFFMNILALWLLCRYVDIKGKYITLKDPKHKDKILTLVLQASKYMIFIVIGYVLGEILDIDLTHQVEDVIYILLLSLLFIVGLLLRLENISITEVCKKKSALIIVILLVVTSILSGIIMSSIVGIPTKQSIMISSGLGWYSLSMVLNTDYLGQYYGMITFLIDFIRELVVLIAIPLLRKTLSVELVGYSANTAMDFCLPVIRNNYGNKVVPLAISIGLMLTFITPLLLIIENQIL